MRYFLRTVIGLGIMVAAFVAVSYAVYQLLQIGTCASGGPYVPARPFMRLLSGAEWFVQLDLDIDPPRTYLAPLDGSSATPGG